MDELQEMHPGIVKMKNLVRTYKYVVAKLELGPRS